MKDFYLDHLIVDQSQNNLSLLCFDQYTVLSTLLFRSFQIKNTEKKQSNTFFHICNKQKRISCQEWTLIQYIPKITVVTSLLWIYCYFYFISVLNRNAFWINLEVFYNFTLTQCTELMKICFKGEKWHHHAFENTHCNSKIYGERQIDNIFRNTRNTFIVRAWVCVCRSIDWHWHWHRQWDYKSSGFIT